MTVRSLFAAAAALAAAGFAAPSAVACDGCGVPVDPCPCVQPVVVADPCCEPPRVGLRERLALRRADRLDVRALRLERRADRIRGRFADDCVGCAPVGYGHGAAYGHTASYGYSSYSSYGHGGYGHTGYGY